MYNSTMCLEDEKREKASSYKIRRGFFYINGGVMM